ncbi:MAG: hypothetical protein JNL08_05285 [Planctomycetes bacterium]|nr:hypothetical protein [Planctomycetota bacterium]
MPQREVTPFSPRAARLVAAAGLLSLLVAFWLLLFPGDGIGIRDVGAHGYSRSAIGHLGLIQLLRDLGEPVLQLRRTRDLDEAGLLVLAEPRDLRRRDDRQVEDWLEQVPTTLLVLPKRDGERDQIEPDWLGEVELAPVADGEDLLSHLAVWTDERVPELLRVDTAHDWQSVAGWPRPELPAPVQLLRAERTPMEPLLWCDEGVLLARIGGVAVLADPDLIANHGLLRGDNAALIVQILRHLRGDARGAVVFDETLHGHAIEPSIWRVAGQFPQVLVSAHLLLLLALVLWIACDRFGAPLPPPAAIAAGKRFLIDNAAALLARGSHHGPSLRRYGQQRVRATAEALHAPRGLTDLACRDWLLARVRDPARRERLAALLGRSTGALPARDAVSMAREIRTLTEEMRHGSH